MRDVPGDFPFCPFCGAALVVETPAREERKVVTVVFCDLVGSTARAEQLDPEDVRALLSNYHARVREQLERFGGTVEKFIGDAVVALFGAPVAHEDDSERAVRAAPLVGRDREVELLVAALERAVGERTPQLVTLVGVPGIGKSRLLAELFHAIERGQRLVTWRQGRSLPYGEGVSFWALGEMVKAQ